MRPVGPRPLVLRLAQVTSLTETLKRFRFEPLNGIRPSPAPPGSHLLLRGGDGSHRNAYSLIGCPHTAGGYEIVVRRQAASRGGSIALHDRAQPGDLFEANHPLSRFSPVSTARHHLMLSAGIGITPFLSFIEWFGAVRATWELHHWCRVDEVFALQSLIDPALLSRVLFHPGRNTADPAALLTARPLGTHLYCCGPAAFMIDVEITAKGLGWPAAKLHAESFGRAGGTPFLAHCRRSDRTIAVAADETLLEALEREGFEVPFLCRGGVCGGCRVRVLEGTPDHRDHVLDAVERTSGQLMLACVSRADGAVTLDL